MHRRFYREDANTIKDVVFRLRKPDGFTLIPSDDPEIDKLLSDKYEEFKTEGTAYIEKTLAGLIKAEMADSMSESDVRYIENKLEKVEARLDKGRWESAEEILRLDITPDAILTQEFYDKLLNDFQDYIAKEY